MKILIFGSSSIENYNLTDELKVLNPLFQGLDTKLLKIPGATISGFGKRNSTLNSQKSFFKTYESYNPNYVCFALGQTDIELGIYYKLVVKKECFSVKEYIEDIVLLYVKSIVDTCDKLFINKDDVILKGNNLSVLTNHRAKAIVYVSRIINENIKDVEERKKARLELSKIYPTVLERKRYTIFFNNALKEIGLEYGFKKYFDVNDEIEDKNRLGHVRLECIPAKSDHHLTDSLFVRNLCIEKLISACQLV